MRPVDRPGCLRDTVELLDHWVEKLGESTETRVLDQLLVGVNQNCHFFGCQQSVFSSLVVNVVKAEKVFFTNILMNKNVYLQFIGMEDDPSRLALSVVGGNVGSTVEAF